MQPMTTHRGDKFNFQGHEATVQLVFANGLVQFSYRDGDDVVITRAVLPACECGAATEGKWADKHSPNCPAVVS